jgi:glycine/D-amino acid oxidase-like deaminating enzyme
MMNTNELVKETEIAVIGGGIVGISTAYYLAKKGKDVVVVERNEVGSEASGANAGFACRPSLLDPILLEVSKVALEEYQQFNKELGCNVEYDRCGFLVLLEDRASLEEWTHQVRERHKLGLAEVDIIDPSEVLKLEPNIVRPKFGAYYDPLSGHINPLYLVQALSGKLKELGGKVYERTEALGIKTEKRHIAALVTNRGEVKTKYIINACGAYSAVIGRMVGVEVPVRPHRHHMMVTEELPPMITSVIEGGGYRQAELASVSASESPGGRTGAALFNQKKDGNILLGITGDFAEYEKLTTFEDICAIGEMAVKYLPLLKDLNVCVIRAWANHYPSTSDYLPILGTVGGIDGFLLATGLNDYGLEVGAGVGKVISELVCFGTTDIPIQKFDLSRFN